MVKSKRKQKVNPVLPLQTFNSFDGLVAGQDAVPILSQVPSYNTSPMNDSVGEWFREHYADDIQAGNVADISFAELLERFKTGMSYSDAISSGKSIDTVVMERVYKELANRLGISIAELNAIQPHAFVPN